MIHRKALVTRHNPKLTAFDPHSPLSVGNGEFVFTADVTGLQSFNRHYDNAMPLCTMANWGWHSTPFSRNDSGGNANDKPGQQQSDVKHIARIKKSDIEPNYYDTHGRMVPYYTNRTAREDYDWVRQNPHKFNLGRIGFVFFAQDGNILDSNAVSDINQTLDLYTGHLSSKFSIHAIPCNVKTAVCPHTDTVAISAESSLIADEKMLIQLSFPYPSHEINGSEWFGNERHTSQLISTPDGFIIKRVVDETAYQTFIKGDGLAVKQVSPHIFYITALQPGSHINLSVTFAMKSTAPLQIPPLSEIFNASTEKWKKYWENGGIISLENSIDPRATELERRIILSQYLTTIQCGGTLPPAETGLTCNSWYGKFHLEMHYWHAAHFAIFNRPEYLEKSLQWYMDILDSAKADAAFQEYQGARWPKMVDPSGMDSPSPIGPLLIWQQPHIILYCDWIYKANPSHEVLAKYKTLVEETAIFMAEYAYFDGQRYVLGPPVIPAQERHNARTCLNPTYELEYWLYGLKTAVWWFKSLGLTIPEKWIDIINTLALPPIHNGVYVAQENSPDTFENVNNDHPSMLMAYGVIGSSRIDKSVMNATLDRVLNDWDYPSMWGWDFGVMAMTATRLGRPETALEVMLKDTEKNVYVINGHNRQVLRSDLPLYLPGNGSLLLAVAMMAAGYEGCTEATPGFNVPGWCVEFEDIRQYAAEC